MVDKDASKTYSRILTVNANISSFVVYPNPVHTSIHIIGGKQKDITIFNSVGEVILQKELSNANITDINVSNFSAGIYWLQVIASDGKTKMERLVLNKFKKYHKGKLINFKNAKSQLEIKIVFLNK